MRMKRWRRKCAWTGIGPARLLLALIMAAFDTGLPTTAHARDSGRRGGSSLNLRGSFRFGREFHDAVELITGGHIDVLALVTAQRPLNEAPQAFRLALDRSQSIKVLLTGS